MTPMKHTNTPFLVVFISMKADICIIFPVDDVSLGVFTSLLEVDNDELKSMEKWIKVLD